MPRQRVSLISTYNMNWTIRVSKTPSLVRVTLRGLFEMDEFCRVVDSVAVAIDDLVFRPVLFDERELDLSRVTMPEMTELGQAIAPNNLAFSHRKVAILVSSAQTLDLVMTLKKLPLSMSNGVIGVFGEEQEACSWIADPRQSQPNRQNVWGMGG